MKVKVYSALEKTLIIMVATINLLPKFRLLEQQKYSMSMSKRYT